MDKGIFLLCSHFKTVSSVYTGEIVLTMIQVVLPFTDIKVEDADRIDLFHLVVAFSKGDMFRDRFRHPIEDAFQIIQFAGILNLYNDYFTFTIAYRWIYAMGSTVESSEIRFFGRQ